MEEQYPLHQATTDGDYDRVQQLLARGIPVDARDNYERTALHLAAFWGHEKVTHLLLDHHADMRVRDNHWGLTPLYFAAIRNKQHIIAHLLDRGATPDPEDESKLTPLAYAAFNKGVLAVKTLVQRGANPEHQSLSGRNAKQWANRDLKTFHYLFSLSKINQALRTAIRDNNYEEMVSQLKEGAQVNGQDEGGNTPLHLAGSVGNAQMIQTLLSCGANPEIPNNEGISALQNASIQPGEPFQSDTPPNQFGPLASFFSLISQEPPLDDTKK